MRYAAAGIALVVCLSTVAQAQRRRSSSRSSGKGIPCGRSYIAANKVCHIDTPSQPRTDSTAGPAPNSAPPATATAQPFLIRVPVADGGRRALFVGSATGTTYYPVTGCGLRRGDPRFVARVLRVGVRSAPAPVQPRHAVLLTMPFVPAVGDTFAVPGRSDQLRVAQIIASFRSDRVGESLYLVQSPAGSRWMLAENMDGDDPKWIGRAMPAETSDALDNL